MNQYIISDIKQLVYVPNNDLGLKVVLEVIRNVKGYSSEIFKIIHLKLENEYVLSMIYEIENTTLKNYPYVYSLAEIIDTLNKNGFNIQYVPAIELNDNERKILTSLCELGYRYIQYERYNEKLPIIYVSKNPLNDMSANQDCVMLDEITNVYGVNDFIWLRQEPLLSMSIELLLNPTSQLGG